MIDYLPEQTQAEIRAILADTTRDFDAAVEAILALAPELGRYAVEALVSDAQTGDVPRDVAK